MSRTSNDLYNGKGRLIAGYDYEHQAWVESGRYLDCGHPGTMACGCYGRLHAGEETTPGKYEYMACCDILDER